MVDASSSTGLISLPEVAPRLSRADGSNPQTDLDDYHITVTVDSVCYLDSNCNSQRRATCRLLIQIYFYLKGSILDRAEIPFNLRLGISAPTSDPNSGFAPITESQTRRDDVFFDVEYWHPNSDHIVVMDKTTVSSERALDPQVNVPLPMGSLGLSGVRFGWKRTGAGKAYIHMLGKRKPFVEGGPVQLQWELTNRNSPYVPRAFPLLVSVQSSHYDANDFFAFDLTLEETLDVRLLHDGRFRRFAKLLKRHPSPGGWVFRIRGNYYPNKADEFYQILKEKEKGQAGARDLKSVTAPFVEN